MDISRDIARDISQDQDTLTRLSITFQQIQQMIEKIKHHYSYGLNCLSLRQYDQQRGLEMVPIFGDKLWVHCNQPKNFRNSVSYMNIRAPSTTSMASMASTTSTMCKTSDWTFFKSSTQEYFHLQELIYRQIITHHYFQSIGSKSRIEPEDLIQFLGLKPNQSYATELVVSRRWTYVDGFSFTPDPDGSGSIFSLIQLIVLFKMKITKETKLIEWSKGNFLVMNHTDALFLINDPDNPYTSRMLNDYDYALYYPLIFDQQHCGYYYLRLETQEFPTTDELKTEWI
jgi:hypothetical protein